MKRLLFVFSLALFFSAGLWGQSVPLGINYQAVARDLDGSLLAGQTLTLKISMHAGAANGKEVYSEVHNVSTSELGLFSLVIGEGKEKSGDFAKIPWSKDEIWMELDLDRTGNRDFMPLYSNKLLAVPYAFHAATADQLKGETGDEKTAAYWKVNGNDLTIPGPHFIGTIDNLDFVFKTNSQERMRITAGGTIDIGGSLDVGGNLDVAGIVHFTNTTQSTTKDNGAVIIEGGVGIEKNTNIGGNAEVDGTLGVDGNTVLRSTTQSTTKDNGALVVEGGVGVEKNVNIGGELTTEGKLTVNDISALNGQVTVHADLTGGDQADYSSYPLRVEGGDHGVAIKVNNSLPDRNVNFVTMYDGSGNPMGRIEGFQGLTGVLRSIVSDMVDSADGDSDDYISNSQSTDQDPADSPSSALQFFNSNYGFSILNSTLDFVYSIIQFAVNAIAASVSLCIEDCDDVVWSGIGVIVNGIKLSGLIVYNEFNLGVAYESGGADYAEWLRKASGKEVLTYGDVVGVEAGIISKDFTNARKFMVISQSPTVIGAMPSDGTERDYEKVAFMGQVPVKVIGVVHKGDYLVPSGNADGMAIAVSPDKMKARDYGRIIGISWGDSDGKKLFDYVRAAVGINANDMAQLVENMQLVINRMQQSLAEVNPNYKPEMFPVDANAVAQQIANPGYTTSQTLEQVVIHDSGFSTNYSNFQEALQPVVQYASEQNIDWSEYPYVMDLLKDPSNVALAEKTRDHYMGVAKKMERIMAQQKPGN